MAKETTDEQLERFVWKEKEFKIIKKDDFEKDNELFDEDIDKSN